MEIAPDERAEDLPIAVLDMDGTLYDGCLGVDFVAYLVHVGLADRNQFDAARDAFDAYARGDLSSTEAADLVYGHYAISLAGQPVEDVRRAAEECWNVLRGGLFPFSRNLIQRLGKRGITTVLVSGSPDEIIQAAARDLGIDHARGALSETRSGRHTGKLLSRPGEPGGKSTVFRDVRPESSRVVFAMGNTFRDEEVMHADVTIAFEPDAELTHLAQARGWHVADRTTFDTVLAGFEPGAPSPSRPLGATS